MAEITAKHNVQQIPAGPEPTPYKGEGTRVEISHIPDYQGTLARFGADTNWMSALGSEVASRASNAIAAKLGSELGKNPKGEVGPSFTEFDKQFQASYNTQASSTLGLQAQKLITQSNLELAAQPRIDQSMIEKAQQSVSVGLQKIFTLAPDSIRPNLEYQYGSAQINQTAHLMERMLREQKEDRQNTIDSSARVNLQNAYSAQLYGSDLDKNGDSKAAILAEAAIKKSFDSAVAIRDKTPKERDVAIDSARQTRQSAKVIRMGLKAQKEGKEAEFRKDLADHPEKYSQPNDHIAVYNNVISYLNNQDQLRSEDENLKAQNMYNLIAKNPQAAIGQFPAFEATVSPLKAAQMKFRLIQALKAKNNSEQERNDLIKHYGSGEAQALASSKIKNEAFLKNVETTMIKDPLKTKEKAETEVALSAGAPVPLLIDKLNNNLTSGNPENIVSAVNQIQDLKDAEGGHALIGLSDQSKAISIQFGHRRGSMPDADLARSVTDNILNIDKDLRTVLDNAWNIQLSAKGASGLGLTKSLYAFALNEVGKNVNEFGIKSLAVIYGNDIYQQLKSNFDVARGDYATALQMTKEYVNESYGETRFNGGRQTSDKPIEKTLGYKDFAVVPFIQRDLQRQLQAKFDENKTDNEYWETKPVSAKSESYIRNTYKPIDIIRHIKTKSGWQQHRYEVMLLGHPGNSWDILLNSPNGTHNIFLVAPHQGIINYTPNQEAIYEEYTRHNENVKYP